MSNGRSHSAYGARALHSLIVAVLGSLGTLVAAGGPSAFFTESSASAITSLALGSLFFSLMSFWDKRLGIRGRFVLAIDWSILCSSFLALLAIAALGDSVHASAISAVRTFSSVLYVVAVANLIVSDTVGSGLLTAALLTDARLIGPVARAVVFVAWRLLPAVVLTWATYKITGYSSGIVSHAAIFAVWLSVSGLFVEGLRTKVESRNPRMRSWRDNRYT